MYQDFDTLKQFGEPLWPDRFFFSRVEFTQYPKLFRPVFPIKSLGFMCRPLNLQSALPHNWLKTWHPVQNMIRYFVLVCFSGGLGNKASSAKVSCHTGFCFQAQHEMSIPHRNSISSQLFFVIQKKKKGYLDIFEIQER